MSERIKELIIETLGREGVVASRAFGHWALSDEQLDKFAELIVAECMNVIYNIDDLGGYHFKAANAVKEHFGVEE